MKTNTYKQFKEWVKFTCTNKISPESYIYEGSTAHAIYTAWYMFKHKLSEQEIDEYIQKDIEKSRKHFYNHGFCVAIDQLSVSKYIPEKDRILIKISDSTWNPYFKCEGGGWFWERGIVQKSWTKVVKSILEYWAFKLMEEMEANHE